MTTIMKTPDVLSAWQVPGSVLGAVGQHSALVSMRRPAGLVEGTKDKPFDLNLVLRRGSILKNSLMSLWS